MVPAVLFLVAHILASGAVFSRVSRAQFRRLTWVTVLSRFRKKAVLLGGCGSRCGVRRGLPIGKCLFGRRRGQQLNFAGWRGLTRRSRAVRAGVLKNRVKMVLFAPDVFLVS